MNYEFTAAEKEKIQAFERFCREEVAPQASDLLSGQRNARDVLRSLFPRLGGVGYLGLSQPEAWGGQGESLILQAALGEKLAGTSPTVHLSAYTSGVHCGQLIGRFGSEGQRASFLRDLLSGRRVAALARTEARGGLDLEGMETSAQRDGDHYLLQGEKFFCVNAPLADFFLVFACLDRGKAGKAGLCCFLVPRDAAGLSVESAVYPVGYVGLPVASLVLKGVRLDKSRLVGAEGMGDDVLRESWQWDALGITCCSIGILEASLETAFAYSQQRTSFGKPIGAYQEVSFKLAEARAMLDTARLLSQKSVWMKQCQDAEAETLLRCAKLYASEAGTKCAGYALQILGGRGALKEGALGELFLCAKANEIGGGTSEMHRIRIAKSVLDSV
ncbi:MAG: acyl-CoA dehydrogenase family protein [bacterium]